MQHDPYDNRQLRSYRQDPSGRFNRIEQEEPQFGFMDKVIIIVALIVLGVVSYFWPVGI